VQHFHFFLAQWPEQEASHAEWADIDFAHRLLRAKPEWGFTPTATKPGKIPLPEELVTMLKECKARQAGTTCHFPRGPRSDPEEKYAQSKGGEHGTRLRGSVWQ
jgi:hypothetical protein